MGEERDKGESREVKSRKVVSIEEREELLRSENLNNFVKKFVKKYRKYFFNNLVLVKLR